MKAKGFYRQEAKLAKGSFSSYRLCALGVLAVHLTP